MIKPKQILLITLLLLLSLIVTGCRGSGAVATSWPGITVDGSTAYIAYNQNIYLIDLDNRGRQIDAIPTDAIRGATFFHAPVLLGDDMVLEGSYSQDLYLIDARNGAASEFFTEARNRWIAAPLFANGVIYAPNSNGTLYALTVDGDVEWSFKTNAALWATPVLDGDTLYLAAMDHFLYAINANTGDEIWSQDLDASLISPPALGEDGTLYVGTFNSQVVALDSENGEILWSYDTDNWVWASPTFGPEGVLYATDINANIYAIDLTNPPNLLWSKQVDPASQITGSVLFYNDTLYVVTETGDIVAYDTAGERLWKESIEEDGKLYGTPILAGDNLILVSALNAQSIIYAYDADLEPLWQYTPEN